MIPDWAPAVYAGIGAPLLFISAGFAIFEDGQMRRNGARLVILSPVWPLLIVIGVAAVLGKLWSAADWLNKK